MTIPEFDHLTTNKKRELLQQCCGSSAWVDKMLSALPYDDLVEALELADEKWDECSESDFLEAFTHHPKIGDINSLKEKFASTAAWASNEQSGVDSAADTVLRELAQGNDDYEQKFGYIFIVCATGKSADEMLAFLKARLPNPPEKEIKIAAQEQAKITQIRIKKLFL